MSTRQKKDYALRIVIGGLLGLFLYCFTGASFSENVLVSPNALYLRSLPDKPWWSEKEDFRIPVLITEPVGMKRRNSPVSVICDFPDDTAVSSIRVVTPYGEEIASQTKVLDEEKKKIEVVFLLDILEKEQLPLFIYYGKKEVKIPNYPTDLILKEAPMHYLLSNNRIEVEILKRPAPRFNSLIRTLRSHGQEFSQIASLFDHFLPGGHIEIIKWGTEAKVIENGPIRKSIQFDDGDSRITYSLYPNSNVLFYYYSGNGALRRTTTFRAGGDTINDYLYYESKKGIKRLEIDFGSDAEEQKKYRLAPHLKEGWLAFCDHKKQEVVGELFEPEGGIADLFLHWSGHRTTISTPYKKGGITGALFCDRGDFRLLRKSYIGWKSPLLVSIGQVQPFREIKPSVPAWGKEFLRGYHFNYGWWLKQDETSAKVMIDNIKKLGGNYIVPWSGSRGMIKLSDFFPSQVPYPGMTEKDLNFLDEIIEQAHQNGVEVTKGGAFPWDFSKYCSFASPNGNKEQEFSAVLGIGHDVFVQYAKENAAHNIDSLTLLEEFRLPPYLFDEEKEKFRGIYHMEPPEKIDYFKLNEPAHYNSFLFGMNAITSLLRDMAKSAREVNPDISLIQITAPSNMTIGGHYHDLETQTDFLTTTFSDLYMDDINYLDYSLKYIKGAVGNNKPVITLTGWNLPRDSSRMITFLHLFCGTGSISCATTTVAHSMDPEGLLGAKEVYNLLDYTELEKYLVKCFQMKFVGIFRDRDNFFGEIKRGNYQKGRLSYTDQRIKELSNGLKNLPTDIIFSKYFTSSLISPYKVIIVPDDPDFSDRNAETIKNYVKEGGIAILEGDTIKNKMVEQLCKVKSKGEKILSSSTIIGQSFLPDINFSLHTYRVPIENEGAEVLAVLSDGSPALVSSSYGRGKFVYSSVVMSSRASQEDNVPILLQKIIKKEIGYLPLETTSSFWSKILTDGKDYLIALYNPSYKEEEINFSLHGFPFSKDTLLSVGKGKIISLSEGKAKLSLGSKEVDFYLLASGTKIPLPAISPQKEVLIHQSVVPSMIPFKEIKLAKKEEFASSKREKEEGTLYVGIFKLEKEKDICQMGGKSIYEKVSTLEEVKAEYISDLEFSTISFYDVIIVPNIGYKGVSNLTKGWERNIRRYVEEEGGGVLLVHHSVGFGTDSDSSMLFPEVGKGTDFLEIKVMEVVSEHPIVTGSSFQEKFKHKLADPAYAPLYRGTEMKKGDKFSSGFPDYIVLKKGESGKIIVRSVPGGIKGGTPAVVIGNVGRGKVVLSGMDMGCKAKKVEGKWVGKEVLTKGEENILVNSVYWLGEEEKQ